MEEARGNRDRIQPQVGQDGGDLERMDEIGLTRPPHLALVFIRREDVRAPEQLDIRVGVGGADLLGEVLEPDHGLRCLTK